jgi:hypothetical protein
VSGKRWPDWIEGSFYQVGDSVKVVDQGADRWMIRAYIGSVGEVCDLDFASGCGESFPSDPLVIVRLVNGIVAGFWKEELEPLALVIPRQLAFPWGALRATE